MNDLAEKALHGLDAARRQVRDHPMTSFGVAGLIVSTTVVVAGSRVAAAGVTAPLTSWLELLPTHSAIGSATLSAALMLTAILALIVLWLVVVALVRRRALPAGRVWWVAAAWAAPLAIGPPLLDTAVYGYAGYGLLQRAGRDPHRVGPSALGDAPVVSAIDPANRGVPSPHGPLAIALQHLSVTISSGSALGAVIVLRVLGVLVAVWIGRAAALLADASGLPRGPALALTVLNPLLLLYVVSAAHLDGLMVALVLTGLAMALQRRWLLAVVLVAAAGSVFAPAFVAVPLVVLAHAADHRAADPRAADPRAADHTGTGTGVWSRARDVLIDLVVATAIVCGLGFALSDGFGWVPAITKQFSVHTPFSIAGATSAVLDPIVRGASYDDLAIGGRITAVIAMGCALCYLIGTARRRPLVDGVALALLAVALLAPVLNAWYLLWGPLCLAPVAVAPTGVPPVRRSAVLALSAAGCVLTPPGFTRTVSDVLTGVLLAVIAAGAAVALRHGASPRTRTLRSTG